MAARSMGSAQISFGLVTIPVKIYPSAQSSGAIAFNMLHQECGTRLKQQLYCPKHEHVVERSEIIKGYDVGGEQYVTFTVEELKALEADSTHSIEIDEFIPADKVDPLYFDRAYYLGPDKGGDKPYRLLLEAMLKTRLVGLARYAARGKDYLVMVRPQDERLVMQQLHYADEVRPLEEVPSSDAEIKDRELGLAVRLIEQISSKEFEPERYEDSVKKRVRELIDKKIAGEEITVAPVKAEGSNVINLMEALEASLRRQAPPARAERTRRPARKAAAKRKVTRKAAK